MFYQSTPFRQWFAVASPILLDALSRHGLSSLVLFFLINAEDQDLKCDSLGGWRQQNLPSVGDYQTSLFIFLQLDTPLRSPHFLFICIASLPAHVFQS